MLLAGIASATVLKLIVENRVLRHGEDDDFSPLHKTARMLVERFGRIQRLRVACGLVGGLALPFWMAVGTGEAAPVRLLPAALFCFFLCFLGNFISPIIMNLTC